MATYRRRGHWRTSRNGTRHWVGPHMVTREGSRRLTSFTSSLGHLGSRLVEDAPSGYVATNPSPKPVRWHVPPEEPNSRCPVCGDPVWFFRNRRGGCAYFDVIGKPWTLHPCMKALMTISDRRAEMEAQIDYERWEASCSGAGAARRSSSRKLTATRRARPAQRTGALVDPQRQEPLDWYLVLSALFALLLSYPVSNWAQQKLEFIGPLLSLWIISLPTLLLTLAVAWFLLRVPRPKFDGTAIIAALIMAPILLVATIAANVVTLGLGIPVLSLLIVSEVKAHRRSAGLI